MTAALPVNDKRIVRSWCMYDWANSAFTTLVVTFIYSTYFFSAFAEDVNAGTALWSRGITASAILIAVLSPVFGAMADRGGKRRRYLVTATLTMAAATTALTFITPGPAWAPLLALTVFVIANVAFEIGIVFYNAYLPDIVTQDRVGRVSGYAWGLGYAGALICLIIGLVAFVGFDPNPGLLGITSEGGLHARSTNLLVAVWVVVFALPLFLSIKEQPQASAPTHVAAAFRDLATAFRNVRQYKEVATFLLARLIYNDGVVTIIAFGGIYAMGTFGFTFTDVIIFGILLNSLAGLGAFAFGFVDDRFGGKRTVMVSIAGLAVAVGVAAWAPSRLWLWVAAAIIGIFLGPNQSASRSLMARFVPQQHKGEFFGFFAFSGKATSFLGPLMLGIVTQAFDSQRAGIATVLLFLLVGAVVLAVVDERRGIEAAGQA